VGFVTPRDAGHARGAVRLDYTQHADRIRSYELLADEWARR